MMDFNLRNSFTITPVADLCAKLPCDAKVAALYEDSGRHLMVESVNLEEIEATYFDGVEIDHGGAMMLEAITTSRVRLDRTMAAFVKALNQQLGSSGLTVMDSAQSVKTKNFVGGAVEIGKVRKTGGLAVIPVVIPLSDGQSITVMFHSPTNDPAKISSNDTLVAFRFLLNKRDVTHVVSPDGGRDISLKQTCLSLANLAERNSGKFQAAKERAEKLKNDLASYQAQAAQLDGETAELAERGDSLEKSAADKQAEADRIRSLADKQEGINEDLRGQIAKAQARKAEDEKAQAEQAAKAAEEKAAAEKAAHEGKPQPTPETTPTEAAPIRVRMSGTDSLRVLGNLISAVPYTGWSVYSGGADYPNRYVLRSAPKEGEYDFIAVLSFGTLEEAEAWAKANRNTKRDNEKTEAATNQLLAEFQATLERYRAGAGKNTFAAFVDPHATDEQQQQQQDALVSLADDVAKAIGASLSERGIALNGEVSQTTMALSLLSAAFGVSDIATVAENPRIYSVGKLSGGDSQVFDGNKLLSGQVTVAELVARLTDLGGKFDNGAVFQFTNVPRNDQEVQRGIATATELFKKRAEFYDDKRANAEPVMPLGTPIYDDLGNDISGQIEAKRQRDLTKANTNLSDNHTALASLAVLMVAAGATEDEWQTAMSDAPDAKSLTLSVLTDGREREIEAQKKARANASAEDTPPEPEKPLTGKKAAQKEALDALVSMYKQIKADNLPPEITVKPNQTGSIIGVEEYKGYKFKIPSVTITDALGTEYVIHPFSNEDGEGMLIDSDNGGATVESHDWGDVVSELEGLGLTFDPEEIAAKKEDATREKQLNMLKELAPKLKRLIKAPYTFYFEDNKAYSAIEIGIDESHEKVQRLLNAGVRMDTDNYGAVIVPSRNEKYTEITGKGFDVNASDGGAITSIKGVKFTELTDPKEMRKAAYAAIEHDLDIELEEHKSEFKSPEDIRQEAVNRLTALKNEFEADDLPDGFKMSMDASGSVVGEQSFNGVKIKVPSLTLTDARGNEYQITPKAGDDDDVEIKANGRTVVSWGEWDRVKFNLKSSFKVEFDAEYIDKPRPSNWVMLKRAKETQDQVNELKRQIEQAESYGGNEGLSQQLREKLAEREERLNTLNERIADYDRRKANEEAKSNAVATLERLKDTDVSALDLDATEALLGQLEEAVNVLTELGEYAENEGLAEAAGEVILYRVMELTE